MDTEKLSEAFVGALIGAALTFITTKIMDWQKSNHKSVVSYKRQMILAEIALDTGIPILLNNKGMLEKTAEVSRTTGLMSSLPATVDFDRKILDGIQNQEYGNVWMKLCLEIELLDQRLEDYREYYRLTSVELRNMLLHGELEDVSVYRQNVIADQFKTTAEAADSLVEMHDKAIRNAIEAYAICLVHADKDRSWRTKPRFLYSAGRLKTSDTEKDKKVRELTKHYQKALKKPDSKDVNS